MRRTHRQAKVTAQDTTHPDDAYLDVRLETNGGHVYVVLELVDPKTRKRQSMILRHGGIEALKRVTDVVYADASLLAWRMGGATCTKAPCTRAS